MNRLLTTKESTNITTNRSEADELLRNTPIEIEIGFSYEDMCKVNNNRLKKIIKFL